LDIGAFAVLTETFAVARKKQCSCPFDESTHAHTAICRAFARHTLTVIARLDRAIQYSRKSYD
jgi:hypothetical protein